MLPNLHGIYNSHCLSCPTNMAFLCATFSLLPFVLESFQVEDIKQDYDAGKDGVTMSYSSKETVNTSNNLMKGTGPGGVVAKMGFGCLAKVAVWALEELVASAVLAMESRAMAVMWPLGKVGTEGNGGNVAFGRGGIVGSVNAGGGAAGVSKRWRAAKLMSMLEIDSAINKQRARKSLENAIFG
ncbi:hypothetical protein Patl1_28301 [Pistacia atlantica]|uniref:Uncharacterized protein n=1 Tax=Pistacia atlantica TaxID=434234 RepID=A0ACC1BDC6_9ROSI|nr:hypothetical protein Patl1_28301 [Pistacia atlantica]